MPIISGGGGGGGPAAGTYLPVADPSSVTVDTTTYANTIRGGGNKLTTLVFPRDTGALAFAVAGDAFPRFLIGTDLNNAGIGLSDGTFDPNGGTAYMYLTGGGTLGLSGYSPPVSSVFGRTGAVAAAAADYVGAVPTALAGSTLATRYVGGVNGAAPTSGTYAVGDVVADRAGGWWVCVTAGTPGTWRGLGASIVSQLENFSGAAVTILNGATTALTWDTPNGTALLNVGTPSAPTIISTGAYAVAAIVKPNADLTAAGTFKVTLATDSGSAIQDSPAASAANPRPTVSVSLTTIATAGGAWSVTVLNRDGVATRDFLLSAAYVQRLG